MAKRDQPSAFQSELEYHRREWAVQRIGWILMAIVLAAAVAGVFGGGPLSRTSAPAGAHRVEYERFARYGARTEIVVNVAKESADGQAATVAIGHSFLDDYRVEAVTPEPRATMDAGEHVSFTFDATSGARIIFRLEPDAMGRHSGEVRIGSDSVHVSQFVYP
jgi:hypothetical protein